MDGATVEFVSLVVDNPTQDSLDLNSIMYLSFPRNRKTMLKPSTYVLSADVTTHSSPENIGQSLTRSRSDASAKYVEFGAIDFPHITVEDNSVVLKNVSLKVKITTGMCSLRSIVR